MAKNYYRSGSWNVTCDVCGIKTKADDTKQRWDGFRVCNGCFEERQPQDFVRARLDKISVPFQRPISTLIFTDVPYICTVDGKTAIVNFATVECSIVEST